MLPLNTKCCSLIYTVLPLFVFTIFLLGFFPIKIGIAGHATSQKYTLENASFSQPKHLFDKLVIVIIDALRSDFVFDKGKRMPFVEKQMNNHVARSFTVAAHPPTVTLPRIKAITTGGIPGFIDIVLNYDSTSLLEDNIIDQARRAGRKLVFYGDDTWISMFPEQFERSEGTSSFFVTDYTEVDNNVTRHLDRELSPIDWDVMILHYLGLDHIGHTAGPSSPLVGPKLLEMDNIIRRIYTALESQPERSVMLVCGDHGISDQGSHGGASQEEVLVPAIFLSPQFRSTADRQWRSSRDHAQIDLAPTLSILLGQPIPVNNLGQVLIDVLDGYDMDTLLQVMYINGQQVSEVLKTDVPSYSFESSYQLYENALEQHASYLKAKSSLGIASPDIHLDVLRAYVSAIDAMTTRISKSLTKFDLYAMSLSVILLLMAFLSVVLLIASDRQLVNIPFAITNNMLILLSIGSVVAIFGHVTVCTSQSYHSNIICGWSLVSVMLQIGLFLTAVMLLYILHSCCKRRLYSGTQWWQSTVLGSFLLLGTLLHSVSFASSSCVEEEHQTWYFLVMSAYPLAVWTTVTSDIRKQLCGKKLDVAGVDGYKVSLDCHSNKGFKDGDTLNKSCDNPRFMHIEQSQNVVDPAVENYYGNSVLKHGNNSSLVNAALLSEQTIYRDKSSISQGNKNRSEFSLLPWKQVLPWRCILATIAVMVLGRCLRSINQTGNKWQYLPDISDWLVRPENKPVLSILIAVSMLSLVPYRSMLVIDRLMLGAGLYGCYRYRVATGTINSIFSLSTEHSILNKGLTEAAWVYAMILLMNVTSVVRRIYLPSIPSSSASSSSSVLKVEIIQRVQMSWILLMTLLLRPHNTILVAMVVAQEWLLGNYILKLSSLPVPYLTLLCWWMGQAVFFQQGNSNSFSSLDLLAGYVGLDSYQPILIVLLIFASAYAGPIFWMISLLKFIFVKSIHDANQDRPFNVILRTNILQAVQVLMAERLFTLALYAVVATVERYHIFVWTVFSPKLMYEFLLTVCFTVVSLVFVAVS